MTHSDFPLLLLTLISFSDFCRFPSVWSWRVSAPARSQTHTPVHAGVEAGVEVEYLPLSLPTLFFEIKSLTDLEPTVSARLAILRGRGGGQSDPHICVLMIFQCAKTMQWQRIILTTGV